MFPLLFSFFLVNYWSVLAACVFISESNETEKQKNERRGAAGGQWFVLSGHKPRRLGNADLNWACDWKMIRLSFLDIS